MFSVQVQRQEKTDVTTQTQAGRMSSLLLSGWSAFLFYSDLQLIPWGPQTLGRAICFIQSIDSNVSIIQNHPHRHTQNMFDQISGYSRAQSG